MSLTVSDRAKGAIWGVLVADALGGPVQFEGRGNFKPVTKLEEVTPFNMPKGAWSDDGSLTMCLVKSLVDTNFQYRNDDFVVKLVAWHKSGYLSSSKWSWDVGRATSIAASSWARFIEDAPGKDKSTKQPFPVKAEGLDLDMKKGQRQIDLKLDGAMHSGNGSLMRVAPMGVAFFRELGKARRYARDNSDTTHPSARCGDACAVYVELVVAAMNGATKKQLADLVVNADVSHRELREKMASYPTIEAWHNQNSETIGSQGYVVPTLEAALWGFFTTDSWKEGALAVANLGGDSDTNAAVYGGLAGAFYGVEQVPWKDELVKKDMLEEIINDFAAGVGRYNEGK